MMQKVLKENILSLVECRTWPSLQSRQARGRRAALTCPEGGGGQCCVSWWCRVVFQSHPRDSWVREGRVPAVAGPGRALSLRTERKRHRSAGVSRALADVPRGDRPPQQPWPRSGGEPGRGLLGVSAAARLGHGPPHPHPVTVPLRVFQVLFGFCQADPTKTVHQLVQLQLEKSHLCRPLNEDAGEGGAVAGPAPRREPAARPRCELVCVLSVREPAGRAVPARPALCVSPCPATCPRGAPPSSTRGHRGPGRAGPPSSTVHCPECPRRASVSDPRLVASLCKTPQNETVPSKHPPVLTP